jgi:uncharacterized protein Smg (DUF494 family)
MKDRVVEILIYIMSEIQDHKRLHEIDLSDLKEKGYTQTEISAAFSWLYDNVGAGESTLSRAATPLSGSRRVFHEAEKETLSTEAQGYLIQLRELGLLDDRDLEQVIERAMLAGYQKLSRDEIHDMVSAVLFGREGGGGSPSRSMLNLGDSIH